MTKNELPQSVSDYITQELDRKLSEIVAHRIINGEEPMYAVLMKNTDDSLFTVMFHGSYKARQPLGDYEEATPGNAVLVRWECFSDADEWEHSVAKFKNAPASFF
jgi:hypothetical protein